MDALHERQLSLQTKIVNSFKNFKSKGPESQSKWTAQARLTGLEEYYKRFCVNHEAILKLKEIDKGHLYFTTNLYDNTEDAFYDRKADFNQFIDNLAERKANQTSNLEQNQSSSAIAPANSTLTSIGLQPLPKIDIPKFTGKYSDWENFRDVFRSLILRRDDMTAVIKLYYLRTHLTGEALDKVKNIAMTNDNFERIWETLTRYYENKRRLVNTHISQFMAIKPMKTESSVELKRLAKETFDPLDSLEALERPANWGDIVIFITSSRFDPNTRRDWERVLGSTAIPPALDQLKEFLQAQILTLESIEGGNKSNMLNSTKSLSQRINREDSTSSLLSCQVTNKIIKEVNIKCFVCNKLHHIRNCDVFKNKPVYERKQIVTSKGLCYNCFGRHPFKSCKSSFRCNYCKGKHHSLLHYESGNSTFPVEVNPVLTAPVINEHMTQSTTASHSTRIIPSVSHGVLLSTARILVTGPTGINLVARALIDPCSQSSIVSQSLCQRLRLQQRPIHVSILGVGNQRVAVSTGSVRFQLQPHFESNFLCEVDALVLPHISSYSPPTSSATREMEHLKGLALADPCYLDKTAIDVLLGASIHARMIEGKIVRGQDDEPVAMLSQLGWLLSGNSPSTPQGALSTPISLHLAEELQLSEILQDFWRQEELPSRNLYTSEEQDCERHFLSSHYRNPTGRYVVRLPIKNPESLKAMRIEESYTPAMRTLQRMEIKFQRDDRLKEAYSAFMSEYLQMGHMIPVSNTLSTDHLDRSFFLPHHGVWKESSCTTKLRTVFNGSTRLKTGISLNDLLHVGPNLLPNLFNLICQWRRYKYVFTADFEKMYRQVLVDERDHHLQSILWRSDPNDPIKIFRLATATYGLSCSAFLASRVIKQLAADHEFAFPLGAKILRDEVYMDDVLSGAFSVEEAIAKQQETIDLLNQGGFPLRKWSSNEVKLLQRLPSDLLAVDPVSFPDATTSVAVLGLVWHPHDDSFRFQIDSSPIVGLITKRSVLSKIARIFDPLGWLSPVVISAKILMQSLWLLKINWDTALPDEALKRWLAWQRELPCLSSLKIARWSRYCPVATTVEVHGFADASKLAYGAVIYLRVVQDSQCFVSLQVAKTRVLPVKSLSIPRLELCAAHLLARLAHQFLEVMPIKATNVYLWSDSQDVLYWLSDHPSRWQVFIANRVSEIHTLLPNAFWQYVCSRENPADVASRGIDPSKLIDHPLWWKGPPWLSEIPSSWPSSFGSVNVNSLVNSSHISFDTPEVWAPDNSELIKESSIVLQTSSTAQFDGEFVSRYSSSIRLFRITACCLRFIIRFIKRIRFKNSLKLHLIKVRFAEVIAKLYVTRDSSKAHRLPLSFFEKLESFVQHRVENLLKIQKLEFLDFSEGITETTPSTKEVESARLMWVYIYQHLQYSAEIACLKSRKPISPKSSLIRLNPFLSKDLLRVGGRLSNAQLEEDFANPLILPSENYLAKLLIRNTHLRTLHGGVQLTLGTLRRQYWLMRGRNAVKNIIRKCVTCIRYSAPSSTQLMGDLPESRVVPDDPFA